MQWFRHPNNFRNDPMFRAIEKKLGEAGYARILKLFEIIAEQGGTADKFVPVLDLNSVCTDAEWLAEGLRITPEELQKTLETFATVELIDPKDWRKQIVRIPYLKKYLDEWTKRKNRGKKLQSNSGATPEQLPSDSVVTTEQLRLKSQSQSQRVEKEAEVESQRKEKVTAAAAALLKEKTKDHWEPLGIVPCGSTEFQEIWETIWEKRSESEKTSDTMERCIQACKQYGVPVPKPFYDAKRKVELREYDEEVGPYLNDEIARMAGPRTISEENMR